MYLLGYCVVKVSGLLCLFKSLYFQYGIGIILFLDIVNIIDFILKMCIVVEGQLMYFCWQSQDFVLFVGGGVEFFEELCVCESLLVVVSV